MNNQLLDQVTLWWKTVSDQEAFSNYQKTIQITWNILRETAKLLWLFLCLGLILVVWIGTFSKQSGQQVKAWYEGIAEPKAENVWSEASQFLTATSKTTAMQAFNQAREQLGLTPMEVRPMAKVQAAAPIKTESAPPVTPAPEVKAEEA
jgi:hypothetical protein